MYFSHLPHREYPSGKKYHTLNRIVLLSTNRLPITLSAVVTLIFVHLHYATLCFSLAASSTKESKNESGVNKSLLRTRLIAKLRESLRMFGNTATADALAHSFFARLNNRYTWIRQAVRQVDANVFTPKQFQLLFD